MYKVCGYTNYECTCGVEEVFAENLNLEDAMALFISLVSDENSLDFTDLDVQIAEWALDFDWDEDDYYSGSYGGSIALYDEATTPDDFDREVVLVYIERDPVKKVNKVSEIEFSAEITDAEKMLYFNISEKS